MCHQSRVSHHNSTKNPKSSSLTNLSAKIFFYAFLDPVKMLTRTLIASLTLISSALSQSGHGSGVISGPPPAKKDIPAVYAPDSVSVCTLSLKGTSIDIASLHAENDMSLDKATEKDWYKLVGVYGTSSAYVNQNLI